MLLHLSSIGWFFAPHFHLRLYVLFFLFSEGGRSRSTPEVLHTLRLTPTCTLPERSLVTVARSKSHATGVAASMQNPFISFARPFKLNPQNITSPSRPHPLPFHATHTR